MPKRKTHGLMGKRKKRKKLEEWFYVEKLLDYNPDDDTYKVKWKGFRQIT